MSRLPDNPTDTYFFTPIVFNVNDKHLNTYLYNVNKPYSDNNNDNTRELQTEYQNIQNLSSEQIIKRISKYYDEYTNALKTKFKNVFNLTIETLARKIILNYIKLRSLIKDFNKKLSRTNVIIDQLNKYQLIIPEHICKLVLCHIFQKTNLLLR